MKPNEVVSSSWLDSVVFAELTSFQKQGDVARGYGKAELKKTKPQTSTFDKNTWMLSKNILNYKKSKLKHCYRRS